jgi:hemoglobin/transferrin/lactoferrin receptor protein
MKNLLVAALALLLGANVFAQDVSEDAEKTKTLKVTATKTERELKEIPMTVNVITAEDIEKSAASSVTELLAEIPGITYEDNGAAGILKVKIRGESSQRTLVIIDGVRQDEFASTVGGIPIMIAPSDIERIEVIKGPASVLYGSNALGGVINIITKKGGGKPFSVTQRMIYDSSSDRFDYYLRFGGSYNGFYYNASFDDVISGDRNTPAGKEQNVDYKRENYTAAAGYKHNDKWDLNLGVQHQLLDGMSRMGTGFTNMDFMRHAYNANFVLRDISDIFTKFSLNAYQQDLIRKTGTYYRTTQGYSAAPQADFVISDHYIIAGGQYTGNDFTSITNATGAETVADIWDASLFVQDEWSVIDKLNITLGVRESLFHFNAKGNSRDFNKFVGNIGAAYLLDEKTTLRAQFSQGFRIPDVYLTFIGSTMLLPNADLEPEESDNIEIGAITTVANINLNASLFYTKAKNYITMLQISTAPSISQYQNTEKAEIYGAEIGVSYDIFSFTPYINATYRNRTYWYKPGSAVEKTSKTSGAPFYGSAGVRWEKEIGGLILSSDLKAIWQGEAEYESSSGSITKYEEWQTYNFQLGVKKGEYFINIAVNNIADKKYARADSSGLYESGIHVVLSGGFGF